MPAPSRWSPAQTRPDMASNTSTFRIFENVLASAVPGVRTVPFGLRYAVYRRVFYSPRHGFAYFRLPKCANSTIVMTLLTAMARKSGRPIRLAEGYEGSNAAKRIAKQGLWRYALDGYLGKKPFAFTFVRDPRPRILSCFLDKIANPQQVYRDEIGMDMRPMSFLDFMQRLDEGYLHANPHWAPQCDLMPTEDMDHLGRVETLHDDLKALVERLFGFADFPIVTKEAGRTNSAARLAEYYGPAEERLVRKLYRRDFERFYPELL